MRILIISLIIISFFITSTLVFALADVLTPNDPLFDSWDEENPQGNNWGQEFIKLPSAWFIETGDKDVKVAVVDGGFDITHEDLKENIGIVGRGNLTRSHGTHVAGIIGAKGDNGKGIAGVMWGSSLYLYSVGRPLGRIDTVAATLAMKIAITKGVKIVNYSSGSDFKKMEDAIKYNNFWKMYILKWVEDKNKDVLFAFAAGNEKKDARFAAPASLAEEYDNVVAVGATNKDGNLADFSNFGKSVSVAAPGVKILSTVPLGSTYDWLPCYEIIPRKDGYGCMSGTSQAAPFVSGLAGLIWSKAKEMGVTLTAKDVKDLIVNGAIKGGKYVFGPDAYPIFIINAYESLKLLAAPPALPWITCSACPEPPEVSIVGNRICMGIADRNEWDAQGISIHGASAPLPQSEKYQITFEFDLHTWDSYNALGTPNPPYYGGTGYWDSFSISISQNPYWTLDLTDPVTEVNLPGLGFLWGGTSYGDGFVESNSGIQTIEIAGDPDIPNYLNVVLDTATLPDSNHAYPSWGCIEVTVIPK